MTWVKLDEQFAQHPKLRAVGPLGLAMQVAALCYSNLYLTDGVITTTAASMLLRFDNIDVLDDPVDDGGQATRMSWERVVLSLVENGLWETVDVGWRIHDYDQYQPTREQVLAEREASRQRQSKFRKSRRDSNVTNTVSNAVSSGEVQGPRTRTSKEVKGTTFASERRRTHKQLLVAAKKFAHDWKGGTSDAFDAGLDELEQLTGARLQAGDRYRLWDEALHHG